MCRDLSDLLLKARCFYKLLGENFFARWFGLRDTYAVEVAPGQDAALLIALTVAVDWMGHEEHDDDD